MDQLEVPGQGVLIAGVVWTRATQPTHHLEVPVVGRGVLVAGVTWTRWPLQPAFLRSSRAQQLPQPPAHDAGEVTSRADPVGEDVGEHYVGPLALCLGRQGQQALPVLAGEQIMIWALASPVLVAAG